MALENHHLATIMMKIDLSKNPQWIQKSVNANVMRNRIFGSYLLIPY
jgi:hypothetical protein